MAAEGKEPRGLSCSSPSSSSPQSPSPGHPREGQGSQNPTPGKGIPKAHPEMGRTCRFWGDSPAPTSPLPRGLPRSPSPELLLGHGWRSSKFGVLGENGRKEKLDVVQILWGMGLGEGVCQGGLSKGFLNPDLCRPQPSASPKTLQGFSCLGFLHDPEGIKTPGKVKNLGKVKPSWKGKNLLGR